MHSELTVTKKPARSIDPAGPAAFPPSFRRCPPPLAHDAGVGPTRACRGFARADGWVGNLGWMVDGWDGCCSADAHSNRQGNSNSSSSPFVIFKKFFFIINQFHPSLDAFFFLWCCCRPVRVFGWRARDRPIDRSTGCGSESRSAFSRARGRASSIFHPPAVEIRTRAPRRRGARAGARPSPRFRANGGVEPSGSTIKSNII